MTEDAKPKRITKAILEEAFAELQEEKAEVDEELARLKDEKAETDARLAAQGRELTEALKRGAVLEQELGSGRLMELDVRRKLEAARTLVGMYQQKFGELPADGGGCGGVTPIVVVLAAIAGEISGPMWAAIASIFATVVGALGAAFGVLFKAYSSVVNTRIEDLVQQRDAALANAAGEKELRERESGEKNELMKMIVRGSREVSGP